MNHDHAEAPPGNPSRWYVWMAVAVLAFYLFTEHRAHLYGVLPYLILLLCPLMHVMGHGGHGHGQGGRDRNEGSK